MRVLGGGGVCLGYMIVSVFIMVLTFFLVYFSLLYTRGSSSNGSERQGINDDEIHRIIAADMVVAIREAISKVFRFINTVMIKMFDE